MCAVGAHGNAASPAAVSHPRCMSISKTLSGESSASLPHSLHWLPPSSSPRTVEGETASPPQVRYAAAGGGARAASGWRRNCAACGGVAGGSSASEPAPDELGRIWLHGVLIPCAAACHENEMPSSLAPHGEPMASELRRLHPIISWFSEGGRPREASGAAGLRPGLLPATASEWCTSGGLAGAVGSRCDAAVDRNRGCDLLAPFCPPIAAKKRPRVSDRRRAEMTSTASRAKKQRFAPKKKTANPFGGILLSIYQLSHFRTSFSVNFFEPGHSQTPIRTHLLYFSVFAVFRAAPVADAVACARYSVLPPAAHRVWVLINSIIASY